MEHNVGEGWHSFIRVFERLAKWNSEVNGSPPVEITEIKEKSGQLRIYYTGGDDRTDAMAEFARVASSSFCEECGKPVDPWNQGGYFRPLCDQHI